MYRSIVENKKARRVSSSRITALNNLKIQQLWKKFQLAAHNLINQILNFVYTQSVERVSSHLVHNREYEATVAIQQAPESVVGLILLKEEKI
jgi:hypothetical protein